MKTFSQFISEVTLGAGENYGSKSYQRRLENERIEKQKEKREKNKSDVEQTRKDRASGIMRGAKNGKSGHFKFNTVTKRFDIFVPD